jgi:hypothetical protein
MKKIYKLIPLLIIAIIIVAGFASCNNEDAVKGVPQISYIRLTNPASSDSLLAAAGQGQLIAIIGDNLQDTREIWFNDQQASLTPTYITKTSILVTVPSHIPLAIDNKLKIIFANGDSLLYNFKVSINKPAITSMDCEYVLDGGTATIRGNYFYAPISVTFPGGVMGLNPSIDATNQILTVTVPQGTVPGQISVTTNFGVTKSDFWFKDNRNIFISSDPYMGWWDSTLVVKHPGPTDPPSINGNYIRVVQKFGAWGWFDVCGGPANTMIPECQNIPDEAILTPSLYNFKFEVCTTKPYNGGGCLFWVGMTDYTNAAATYYKWNPPYDTKGQWQTIVIPYEDVVSGMGIPITVNHAGYFNRLSMQGATALDCDMSFDNFRVVPKTIKP